MIREAVAYFNSDTSIVRQYKEDITLIYNRTKKTSSFMLVTEGVIAVPAMYMEPLFVNDFEIMRDKAYFCGYTMSGETRQGILGYFELSTFPSCTVSYYNVSDCKEMIKLDVYSPGAVQEKKMVATGTTDGVRSDALAELTLFASPTFNLQIHVSYGEHEYFDDVAQTSGHIVVSSRNVENNYSVVNLWQYQNPLTPGMSMFNFPVYKKQITFLPADSPVYLEYMDNNEYSAVYKNRTYSHITVLKTDVLNTTPVSGADILGVEEGVKPKDIKWNPKTDVYDVLTFYHSSTTYPMQIYHLPSSAFNSPMYMGAGTKYANVQLWSIDPCLSASPYFMASGSVGSLPKLFRYSSSGKDECPDTFYYFYEKVMPEWYYSSIYIYTMMDNQNPVELVPREVEIPFPKVCGKWLFE